MKEKVTSGLSVSGLQENGLQVYEWHIECLVCGAQYYLVDYPRKGCRNCGRDALLITDHRVDHRVDHGVDRRVNHRVDHERKEESAGGYRGELTGYRN